jgi:predicted DNA-binding protein
MPATSYHRESSERQATTVGRILGFSPAPHRLADKLTDGLEKFWKRTAFKREEADVSSAKIFRLTMRQKFSPRQTPSIPPASTNYQKSCRRAVNGETRSLTKWYYFCYTLCMKTAISIPNDIYENAEQLANQQGKSRSQLYTQAVSQYVAKHQKDNITKQLNDVYKHENSSLDSQLAQMQAASLPKETW